MSLPVIPVRRALLSVSDKTGLIDLARGLTQLGCEILSTGGSAKALREAGVAVKDVSEHTGFPEILDGRVKTLVPQIHGGILGQRDNAQHIEQMAHHAIAPIDLVCVNLYPFEATVVAGADEAECIENIDIGGPTLIRAAAKNHAHVVVLTSPSQYAGLLDLLQNKGGTTFEQRKKWAGIAYAQTAAYDAAIAQWFAQKEENTLSDIFAVAGKRQQILRYGENSHQCAAFYRTNTSRPGVGLATQIQGKELSYNNLNDTDAAFEAVAEFKEPAVVIVKHANPCGVAQQPTLLQAWEKALACDPTSAFGGIVAMNRTLDEETATAISTLFTEVIIAPDATEAARNVLSKKKNLRLLLTGQMPDPAEAGMTIRSIAGGFLLQNRDNGQIKAENLKVVTERAPSAEELRDLIFAFKVCKHVKSNAIIYAKDLATVGIGAGQMSRVDSAKIAVTKSLDAAKAQGIAGPLTQGSVVASDAFFPFADGLEAAISAGATAVIQPGGSIRDQDVIDAANKANIAMVFTGMRHFRH